MEKRGIKDKGVFVGGEEECLVRRESDQRGPRKWWSGDALVPESGIGFGSGDEAEQGNEYVAILSGARAQQGTSGGGRRGLALALAFISDNKKMKMFK